MSESVVTTPQQHQTIEPAAALAISRALHSDLDLEGVMSRFHACVTAICPITRIRYCKQSVEIELGDGHKHSVNYQPEFKDQTGVNAGEFHFYADDPISTETQATIEELLALGARAFFNAYTHFIATGNVKTESVHQKSSVKVHNHTDALVVARVNGLDQLRQTAGAQQADRVLRTLKDQLSTSLRDADLTMDVDQEHIAIILPCTSTDGAAEVAKKVGALIHNMTFLEPIERACLSVSTGIGSSQDAQNASEVLEQAKRNLPEQENCSNAFLH